MTKPKKPLRGLFASTEAPARTPVRPSVPPPSIRRDRPEQPVPAQKPKPTPADRLTPPPRKVPVPQVMIMKEDVETNESTEDEVLVIPASDLIPVIEPEQPVELIQPKEWVQPAQPTDRIMNIQYNFDVMRTVRESWSEGDYAEFLKRLDALQTEAFILRGKLLAEAKDRFFETNKIGWAEFCEAHLGMNYTTANQYIRVATEFDVTSHQRTDFGFEHFKALLPLSIEVRSEILNSAENLSVKMIRTRVKEILAATTQGGQAGPSTSPLRQSARLIRMLEIIKKEVIEHGDSFVTLTQPQRWQIAAACQNIAAHLNHLALELNADPTSAGLTRQLPTSRAGAFATADGVANMQEVLTQQGQSGSTY